MIRFLVYKDMYVPVVEVKKNFMVAKVVCYYIFRKRKLDLEELHALVSNEFGGKTSPRLKHFIYKYVKKLEGYGLVYFEENDKEKMIYARATPFPLEVVRIGLLHYPNIERKVNKNTLKDWRRGKRNPSIEKILEVLV